MTTPNAIIFRVSDTDPDFQLYTFKGDTLVDGGIFHVSDEDSYNDLKNNQIAFILLAFNKLSSKLLFSISLDNNDTGVPAVIREIPFEELERCAVYVLDNYQNMEEGD